MINAAEYLVNAPDNEVIQINSAYEMGARVYGYIYYAVPPRNEAEQAAAVKEVMRLTDLVAGMIPLGLDPEAWQVVEVLVMQYIADTSAKQIAAGPGAYNMGYAEYSDILTAAGRGVILLRDKCKRINIVDGIAFCRSIAEDFGKTLRYRLNIAERIRLVDRIEKVLSGYISAE